MSRNKYQPIDFVGLTKVLRAHATQISPPGMYELKNVYISRSDNSATLRPNFLREETGMVSVSGDLQESDTGEFLTGIYQPAASGVSGKLYFSNQMPFSFHNNARTDLPHIYSSGTITTSGTNGIVLGTATGWLKYIWAGCFLRLDGGTDLYRITDVKSDIYILTDPNMPAVTDSEYEIVRTHPEPNGEWPMQFDKLGNLMVYNPSNPQLPINTKYVSGPFYSDVGRADVFGLWQEDSPDISVPSGDYLQISSMPRWYPSYYGYMGTIDPLLVGGEFGLIVSNDQWVGDYNSDLDSWAAILAKYYYWDRGALYSDVTGRMVFPEGNTYPTVDDFWINPYGSDSPITSINWASSISGYLTLKNGDYVGFENTDQDMLAQSPEQLRDDGPWILATIYPAANVIDSPCHGSYQSLGGDVFIFGGNGQITTFPATVHATGVTSDIYAAIGVEVDGGGGVAGQTNVFVGGIDSGSATIITIDYLGNVARQTSGVTEELYDITYMLAVEASPPGIGRLVAVGAAGTIIHSDDEGVTWVAASSIPTDATGNLRAVMADPQGRCVMAVGDTGEVLTSQDGDTWEELIVTSKNLIDLAFDRHRGEFLLLAEGGD
ncbi:MAG TPA: hypothetical protein VFI02_02850, partial [Armatimonadota bacterium]|nr:hypothetical protein [Armatimonadota bacterium]